MKSKDNKTERVIVSVRIRPFNEDEINRDISKPIEVIDKEKNIILVKKDHEKKTFSYDNLLPIEISQVEVFDKTTKTVLDSVLNGFNGTIMAYGQTGTGKTYTMVGDFNEKKKMGIIPRSLEYLFDNIKKDKEYKYQVSLSFIQIYLETIQDLLEPSNENIRIREDPEKGVYLEGVESINVSNLEQCKIIFEHGEKSRVTASTKFILLKKDEY